MKLGKLLKYTFGMCSVCYTAWQMPHLMDMMQGKPGATATPGLAGLLGALNGGVSPGAPGSGDAAAALLSTMRPGTPRPDGVTKPEDMVLFSADGTALTPAQREKLLKEAAKKAPLKPGAKKATSSIKQTGPKASPVRGGKPGEVAGAKEDPMVGIEQQSLEDITKQLQEELAKTRKP